MDWILNMPEPFRTIIATIIAVLSISLLFGGPVLIIMIGVGAMLDTDSSENNKDY